MFDAVIPLVVATMPTSVEVAPVHVTHGTSGPVGHAKGQVKVLAELPPEAMLDMEPPLTHCKIHPPSQDGKAIYPVDSSNTENPLRSFFGVTKVASSVPALTCA
ncbi:hypothetical protein D3C77_606920 [compost metagenome]